MGRAMKSLYRIEDNVPIQGTIGTSHKSRSFLHEELINIAHQMKVGNSVLLKTIPSCSKYYLTKRHGTHNPDEINPIAQYKLLRNYMRKLGKKCTYRKQEDNALRVWRIK
mgnify:CR=1 FL=1